MKFAQPMVLKVSFVRKQAGPALPILPVLPPVTSFGLSHGPVLAPPAVPVAPPVLPPAPLELVPA